MRGRTCTALLFAILVLLFLSLPGQAKTTAKKQTRHTSQNNTKVLNTGTDYSVRAGDNLYRIAKNFGTTPTALQAANRLKSSNIKVGQVLKIPVTGTEAAEPKPSSVLKNTVPAHETYISAAPKASVDTAQTADAYSSSTPLRLAQAGFELIGVRYKFGGTGNGSFDCSGLVKNLFSKFNIELPRSSKEQYKQGQKVSRDDLKVGDLVFFSSGGSQPTHVGIYMGDDKFLHAARKARKVVISDLSKLWYTMRYIGARRVMDLWSDEPVTE
jgi:cell wall-associated NlpC family hydrolase